MYICLCTGLREAEFSVLASCHGRCPEAMKRAMGLDDACCGRCEANLDALIQDALGVRRDAQPEDRDHSTYERMNDEWIVSKMRRVARR